MKRIFGLITLLILTLNFTNAQRTHLLGATIGTTTPLGNFSKQDDSSCGSAKGGLCYIIDYDFVSPKNWGGFFSISNQSFGFDADKYTDLNDPDFLRTSYSWTNYNLKSLNFGVSYILNKNSKVSFMPKLGTGFSVLRNMSVDAEYLLNSSNTVNYNEFTEASLFSNVNLGLDIQFRKSTESQLGYFMKFNFLSGSTEITQTGKMKVNSILFDQTIEKFNRNISSYTFSIGVKYIFKSKNSK